jgi:hypothetical protein
MHACKVHAYKMHDSGPKLHRNCSPDTSPSRCAMILLFCIELTPLWAKGDAALSAQHLARELGEPKVAGACSPHNLLRTFALRNLSETRRQLGMSSHLSISRENSSHSGERLYCEYKLLSDRRRERHHAASCAKRARGSVCIFNTGASTPGTVCCAPR